MCQVKGLQMKTQRVTWAQVCRSWKASPQTLHLHPLGFRLIHPERGSWGITGGSKSPEPVSQPEDHLGWAFLGLALLSRLLRFFKAFLVSLPVLWVTCQPPNTLLFHPNYPVNFRKLQPKMFEWIIKNILDSNTMLTITSFLIQSHSYK